MKKIFSLFWYSEGNMFSLEKGAVSLFKLMLGNLKVGELSYDGSLWRFSYSEEFKRQKEVLPLVNFPTKEKEYESEELWPFFASRIPSDAQLQTTNTRDIVSSLKRYGRSTIANAFVLLPA